MEINEIKTIRCKISVNTMENNKILILKSGSAT